MSDPNQIKKMVGTRPPGVDAHMKMGWPGVIRVLTPDEKRQSERDWDARVKP